MYDYHMHLEQGSLTLEWLLKFLDRAREVGIREIGVTEHLYRFREARTLLWNDHVAARSVYSVDEYVQLMEEARSRRLPVSFGLEADYVPGKEDQIAKVLDLFPLDFVIGSVHWLGDWGFDLDAATWRNRSVEDTYRRYYDTLGQAAESGLFDVVGHPGNIAYYGFRPGASIQAELENAFLERITRLPVVLEINTGGLLRPARELFPRAETARRIVQLGFPVSTGSDAHRPQDVGCDFPRLYRTLQEWGLREVTCFSERKRVPKPVL